MKGFEIQINGGAPIVIAAEHYAFALLGCVNGEEPVSYTHLTLPTKLEV